MAVLQHGILRLFSFSIFNIFTFYYHIVQISYNFITEISFFKWFFMKITILRRDILCRNSLRHCIEKELRDGKLLAKCATFSRTRWQVTGDGVGQNVFIGVKASILKKLWRVGYSLENSIRGGGGCA